MHQYIYHKYIVRVNFVQHCSVQMWNALESTSVHPEMISIPPAQNSCAKMPQLHIYKKNYHKGCCKSILLKR